MYVKPIMLMLAGASAVLGILLIAAGVWLLWSGVRAWMAA